MKRHLLHEIMMIALCAALSGRKTWADIASFGASRRDFFQTFLLLEDGMPGVDVFSGLFRQMDTTSFSSWIISFMASFAAAIRDVHAGRDRLRHAFDCAVSASPLNRVSVSVVNDRLVLSQVRAGDSSIERIALPKLLKLLSLDRTMIAAEVRHCRPQLATAIARRGGDYVLPLDDQFPLLFDCARRLLDSSDRAMVSAVRTDMSDVSRENHRASLADNSLLQRYIYRWCGLAAVGRVTAAHETERSILETRYYLLSRTLDAAQLDMIVRPHFSTSNRLHWRLDIMLDDERSTPNTAHPGENLALLHLLALTLIMSEPSSGPVPRKFKRAAREPAFLVDLFALAWDQWPKVF